MRGVVVKGLGGLFEVLTENGRIACRARGTLKRDEEKVLIGDRVELDRPDGEYVIAKVDPRKNSLIRPPIANLDALYCVIAAARPAPALETLDKLLAIAENKSVRAAIVVTKTDGDKEAAETYAALYRQVGYPVFSVSSLSGEGIDELKADLTAQLASGGTAAFAGASGVGKSTLLNRLLPGVSLETGEICRRVERGRHTTRHVELFPEGGGFVADTPGFSMLDFARFDFFSLSELFDAFPEFGSYRGKCRYADCTHTGEGPDECAVARAVRDGQIPQSRHDSYRALFATLKNKTDW
ncbi:MAG: ribosome small subunit-dependent GTPase A [Clostridia bacterium]|nr:ribosome small subunit-dependent GTPase A [Clostridia bacterium]